MQPAGLAPRLDASWTHEPNVDGARFLPPDPDNRLIEIRLKARGELEDKDDALGI
jgi:hypothetical protein